MKGPLNASAAPAAAWLETVEQTASRLETDRTAGLSGPEAQERLAATGRNELAQHTGRGPWLLFLGQFRSTVVIVLLLASLLSVLLHELADAAAILAIVLLNAGIGFFQEFHAEQALAALRALSAPGARVVRDGTVRNIAAAEVVPGDLLLLEAGDLVAADARVTEAYALRTDEAPLTGESVPVEKGFGPLADPETPLAERENMVFLGTSVVHGQGRALVVATGRETEVGKIAGMLGQASDRQTPLQRRLDEVGRSLLLASLGIVALVFVLGVFRGEQPVLMLLTAVSLAIAAVPEGLPAVVTIALTLGVGRMVRRHALVRRLAAVETLGAAQVICTDKTGTLTMGQMTVRSVWSAGKEWPVTGEGYEPTGEFRPSGGGRPPELDAAAHATLAVFAACNDAHLRRGGAAAEVIGDPTEAALLVAAAKAGIYRETLEAEQPRVETFPFDSDRQRMTVIRRAPIGPRAYVKGAPEALLPLCTHTLASDGAIRPLNPAERSGILAVCEQLAQQGLRVLAAAYRDYVPGAGSAAEIEQDLVFAGLAGMNDPPRPEAREAVAACRSAGIRVLMLTGDHPATAAAVARELDLATGADRVITGTQLQHLSDADIQQGLREVAVIARVTAADKHRVVRALAGMGYVVAMTGDGVNDAPALQEAAIGITMGRSGTEVTKQVADMVITDDNFASIVAAVEEGRGIYDNIRKCLQYLLAGNTAEILVMLVAVLVGWPIPLLPLQLLWINLATDGLPALALAADPVDRAVLNRPPRPSNAGMADRPFFFSGLLTGALTATAALLAFYFGYGIQGNVAAARNYAFSTLVYAELLRSLGARSPELPLWSRSLPPNRPLLVVVLASLLLQYGVHQVPILRQIFDTEPLTGGTVVLLLLLGALPLAVLEVVKLLRAMRMP